MVITDVAVHNHSDMSSVTNVAAVCSTGMYVHMVDHANHDYYPETVCWCDYVTEVCLLLTEYSRFLLYWSFLWTTILV